MKNKIYLIIVFIIAFLWLLSYNVLKLSTHLIIGIILVTFLLIIKKILKIKIKLSYKFWIILLVLVYLPISIFIRKRSIFSSLTFLIILLFLYYISYLGDTKYPWLKRKTRLNIFGILGILALITGIVFLIAKFMYPIPNISKLNFIVILSLIIGVLFISINYLMKKNG